MPRNNDVMQEMPMFQYDGFEVIRMAVEGDKGVPFATLAEAHAYCRRECGNSAYSKPFAGEEMYLYGPGDGDTSHMIHRRVVGLIGVRQD